MRLVFPLLSLSLALTGCAITPDATPTALPGSVIEGSVHGGQQPYVNSRVFLFAAGTSGYGGPSVSLLKAGPTTTVDPDPSSATYLDAYTLTDGTGSFSITGDYACTPNTQVYLYVYGGRPAGPNILGNTAAGFLAILGNCPASGTFAPTLPIISVNEVTTVAAAYAFAGFATDALHVSSSGTPLAKTGIANAFANATNLVDLVSGAALATTPAGNGIVPQATINTLANILAACINSNDDTSNPSGNPRLFSGPCLYLVKNATVNGTSTGPQPSDTANAALNIAHNPGANIATLFALPAASPPFLPNLIAPPNDFTIGIQFVLPGLAGDGYIAIDALGNAWIDDNHGLGVVKMSPLGESTTVITESVNGDGYLAIDKSGSIWLATGNTSIQKISSSGLPLSPPAGFPATTSQSLDAYSVAIDGTGNAWTSNRGIGGTVSKLSPSGSLLSPSNGYSGGGGTSGNSDSLAIDGEGNIWTLGFGLTKFSPSGSALSPPTGYATGTGSYQHSVVIDAAGDVWFFGSNNTAIYKFSNSGVVLSPTNGYAFGTHTGGEIALDGAGNLWATGSTDGSSIASNVFELANDGTAITPRTGYAKDILGFNLFPQGIAIDGSGDVWVSSSARCCGFNVNNEVLEMIGAAVPVITPIAAGLPATPTADGSSNLGTRP